MRVFIAEADRQLRLGLQMLLNHRAGMQVTGIAVESKGLVAQVAAAEPDVLLLAWDLPGAPVLDLLADLRRLEPRPKLVVMAARPEVEPAVLAAGADAFASKCKPPGELLAVVRTMDQAMTTDPSK